MTHPRLSPRQCHELVEHESFVHLDVRTVPEFEQGHPLGAYNVPLEEPTESGAADNPLFIPVVMKVFERAQPIVVGCRSGKRSRRAAELLSLAGYRVVEQRAGYQGSRDPFGRVIERGWLQEGLPTKEQAEPGRDYASLRARAER